MRPIIILTLVSLMSSATPVLSAQAKGSLADSPNVLQWQDIAEPMATLIADGYSMNATTDMVGTNQMDITSTFYLVREKDLVRCSEGFRPSIHKSWVQSCQRLVAPFVFKRD